MPPEATQREPMALNRRQFGRSLAVAFTTLPAALLKSPAGAAAEIASMAPDIKTIKDRGQLIVGMTTFDSPPFYYASKKDGADPSAPALKGCDVQLANDLAQVLDVKLVLDRRASAFNGVIDSVVSESVDLAISKLSMTARRAISVRFTLPIIELRHALLVNRISLAKMAVDGNVKSVINRNFAGQIGVIANSSYAEIAKQVFTKASRREFGSWEEIVDAVDRGLVDLAYRDELEIKKVMHLRPELHLTVRSVLITDFHDPIAVAVPVGKSQLLSLVNVVLSQRQHYDANQLLDKYSDIFQST